MSSQKKCPEFQDLTKLSAKQTISKNEYPNPHTETREFIDQNSKRNESVSVQDDDAKRNEKSSLHTQTSKRRNEWDNDNLIGRSVPRGGKLNEIQEGKGESSLDGGDSSSLSSYDAEKVQRVDEKPDSEWGNGFDERCRKFNDGGGSELEAESPEEAEDEDEGHEYGHKAVEWTEDDQKNLMDLGTSEIERNKRLESLIAKRRARKLMKMRVEKDLIDLNSREQVGQIAPILIARNNLLHLPNDLGEAEDLPVPGSAPSVLLPGRNPFDLPYDPQEEKPNLLGDSFQQEFTMPHQKEMFFCRHESFTLGSFYSGENKQEPHSSKRCPDFIGTKTRALEGSGFSRFKWSPNNEDKEKIFEEKSSQHDESKSHIESDQQGGEVPKPAVDSVGTFHEKDRETDLSMIKTEGKDEANTSDMESEPSERNDIPMKPESVEDKNDESSSSSLSEAKEHSGQENEVSPHSNPSPNDGDMNKEVTSGSEETWVASSHLSGVEENESSLRKVNEINEEDIIIQVGFSGVDQDSEDSIPLAVHPGQGASSPTEKSAREASSIYNVSDPALHASDGMEDLKSIKGIDDEPLADKTNPKSIANIEDEPEKLAVEENDNSTTIEDLVQKPGKLTTQESNVEEAEPIEDKDNLKSIQDSEGDQGNVEAGSFGGDQSSDAFSSSALEPERVFNQGSGDLIASAVQPESAVEQISNNSSLSSSPKSVLPEKVPVDQVSSWSFNPEHLMEDSVAHSPNNSDYEGQQEPSNPSEKTSGANISYNINESVVHDKEGEEKKSIEDNEGKSQSVTSISQEAAAESSRSDEEISSKSIEDNEDGMERTSAHGTNIGPSYDSYPAEENANSDIPATMANEKELSNLPMKSTEEVNIIHNLNRLEVSGNATLASEEGDKALEGVPKPHETTSSRFITDIEAESNTVTEDEAINGATKAMGENENSISTPDTEDFTTSMEHGVIIFPKKTDDAKDNSESITDVEGDSKNSMGYEATICSPEPGNLNDNWNIPITVPEGEELSDLPPEKSMEEANIILSENEAEAGQMDIKQTSESVGDGEGDYQSSIRQFAVVEPSETTEVTNPVTTQDTEGKSGNLIHDNNVMDTPEPVEDNATLDTNGDVKENKGETADLSQDDIGTNK
eukprot:XP_010650934.2 PREDICTED: uncharacterized protein LOC104879531 [Vitis vinifera]